MLSLFLKRLFSLQITLVLVKNFSKGNYTLTSTSIAREREIIIFYKSHAPAIKLVILAFCIFNIYYNKLNSFFS